MREPGATITRRRRNIRVACFAAVGCLAALLAWGGWHVARTRDDVALSTEAWSPDATKALVIQLNDSDVKVRRSALQRIGSAMEISPGSASIQLARAWREPLLRAGYSRELCEWTRTAITSADSIALLTQSDLEFLVHARVLALLRSANAPAALRAARSFYNVVRVEHAPLADSLIRRCLTETFAPSTVLEQYAQQQRAGMKASPVTDAMRRESVILNIRVDPQPYETAIAAIQSRIPYLAGDERSRMKVRLGNLLLLANRTKEARQLFQNVLAELERGDAPRWRRIEATENLARAVRADEGVIGNAALLLRTALESTPPNRSGR